MLPIIIYRASGFVTRADYGPSKVGVTTVNGQTVDV